MVSQSTISPAIAAIELARLSLSNSLESFVPARLSQLAAPVSRLLAHKHLIEAALSQAIDLIAPFIGQPFLIHIIIDARQSAHNFAAAAIETDIRANSVRHINAERLFEFPGTRFKGVGP